MDVKVGDIVVLPTQGFTKLPYDGEEYFVGPENQILAKINKNGQIFYIGSNGKFIKNDFLNNQLPFIFGNPEVIEFFNIKEIIDKSKISYSEIKNLYFFPSKRWDLELRDNTIIKLPNDNIKLALNLAIEFLDDNKFIDARIKNQIILND